MAKSWAERDFWMHAVLSGSSEALGGGLENLQRWDPVVVFFWGLSAGGLLLSGALLRRNTATLPSVHGTREYFSHMTGRNKAQHLSLHVVILIF